jgi:hypothetical protein
MEREEWSEENGAWKMELGKWNEENGIRKRVKWSKEKGTRNEGNETEKMERGEWKRNYLNFSCLVLIRLPSMAEIWRHFAMMSFAVSGSMIPMASAM